MTEPTYGLLTFDDWLRQFQAGVYLHVLFEDRDVTERCFVADDRQDWIGVYAMPKRLNASRTGPEVEVWLGRVVIDAQPV